MYVQYVCAYVFVYIGEWENSCNELQRMCIVRSLRPDRVPVVVTSYINNNLGHDFTDPPVLNMASVLEDSSCRVPLIFVLSPGVVRGGEGREKCVCVCVCVCVCDGLGCDSDTGEWRGGVCCGVWEPVTWSVGDMGSTAVLECSTHTTCSRFRAMCLRVVPVRTQDPTHVSACCTCMHTGPHSSPPALGGQQRNGRQVPEPVPWAGTSPSSEEDD